MQVNIIKSFRIKLIIICILMCFFALNTIAFGADFSDVKTNGKIDGSYSYMIELSRQSVKGELYCEFVPTKTGLYSINAYNENWIGSQTVASYRLDRIVNRQLSTMPTYVNVSLASIKKGSSLGLANPGNNAYNKKNAGLGPNQSRVYVILDANSKYSFRFFDDMQSYKLIIRKATEESGATYGFSPNFPSAWVTMGQKDTAINSNDPVLDNYPRMEVTTAQVNEVIEELNLQDKSGQDHSLEWLESILVYIIFAIGNLIVQIFEAALGIKGLTLDGIIFNKLSNNVNNPTIDLRPLRRYR